MSRVPILLAAILVGCSGADVPPAATVTIAAPPQVAAPAATEAPTASVAKVPTRPKPTVIADAAIGVPECDEYVARVEACLPKVPIQAREAVREAFGTMREAWQQAALTPEGRTGLKTACHAALGAVTANPMCK